MDWLKERTAISPHAPALIINAQTWTYAELDRVVQQTAVTLHNNSIRQGDHVAALLPNSIEYVCLVHAAARIGAVLVPLNGRLTPAELQWQINHVGCKILIGNAASAKAAKKLNCQLLIVNCQLSMRDTPLIIDNCPLTIDHYQSIIFTSGTTGRPKGAVITFANHFWSATASAYRLGVSPNDRWLSVLPLYHVGGLAVLFRSCLYGTAVILHDRFRLPAINASLDNDSPTLISLVPTMLRRLLASRDKWPASLRLILLGGAAASAELIEEANKLSINNPPPLVAPTYGLTEATSQVTTMRPDEAVRKQGCVGKPLMFTSVKIINENGESVSPNQIGEIIVTGPTVMAGYFQKKSRFLQKRDFLATGDLGYLDEDGDLWIVQRRTDLIVTGGENVYPSEVERVLRGHTAVFQACIVGLNDGEWGQIVAAMVQLRPSAAITKADLLTFCRQRLAGYKLPRYMRFVDALPQTASGKIARHAVKEQLAAGRSK